MTRRFNNAVSVLVAALAIGIVAAPVAQAKSTKAAAPKTMTVKVAGKTTTITSLRDAKAYANHATVTLQKNFAPIAVIAVAGRSLLVQCATGAFWSAVNTTAYYVFRYWRLPSGAELWSGTRGGCWILRYL